MISKRTDKSRKTKTRHVLLLPFILQMISVSLKRSLPSLAVAWVFMGLLVPVWCARGATSILKGSTLYVNKRLRTKHIASAFGLCLLVWIWSVLWLSILFLTNPFSWRVASIATLLMSAGAYSFMVIPDWPRFRRQLSTGNPTQVLSLAFDGSMGILVLAFCSLAYLGAFLSRISWIWTHLQ